MSESPPVEHSAQELLTHEVIAQVVFLYFHLDWFECALMPLLNSDSLFELAEALYNFHELLESVVALRVEFAVLEELIHGLLLALLEHVLK